MAMSNEQYVLIRRMMAHNERPRMPRDERDRAENLRAVRMITLIGCLDYAMLDLRSSLEAEGRFVRLAKRNFNRASACISGMHDEVMRLIRRDDGVAVRIYSDLRDKNWWLIDEHIHLGGVEGSYGVVMALCRLIESCNRSISSRYNYRSVDKLRHVRDMLSVLDIEDKGLDIIIDKAIVVK